MTTPADRMRAECEAQGLPLVVADEGVLRRTAARIRLAMSTPAPAPCGDRGASAPPLADAAAATGGRRVHGNTPTSVPSSSAADAYDAAPTSSTPSESDSTPSESDEPGCLNTRVV